MKSIHTETEINAPIEKVWAILMDFSKYPEWNPFVKSLEGNVVEGGKFKVVLQLPEGKVMTFKPRCLTLQENKEFRWMGHLLISGLFDGEHIFKMRKIDDKKTKLVQCENFKGMLVPMFWKQLNSKTIKGFEMMNRALKDRAEKA
jgi:hypothetical protein